MKGKARGGGYDITALGYFMRGAALLSSLKKGFPISSYFYTAFEFRCCIERLLFEHLYAISSRDFSKNLEKLYLANRLKVKILEVEPDFIERIKFANLSLTASQLPIKLHIPDLDTLDCFYGRLGGYLHAQKRPEKTCDTPRWWEKFFDLLVKSKGHLEEYFDSPIGHLFLAEDIEPIFQDWNSGSMSDDDVIRILRKKIEKGVTQL